ncbi:SpoIIE family protein phosphatase [Streptomyces sp. NPDC057460]|uniref:SpoIIE family protein phosphatase n=1 Tax=Streptomyces sp. NPDC057460 TaxID=3346141 RepID=UPI0036ADB146
MGAGPTAVHPYAAAARASPGEVLACTNRLFADLDPGLFASRLIAHLDHTHHRALLVTARYPLPCSATLMGTPTSCACWAAGHRPGCRLPHHREPLPPGAALALYTDGLVETPGHRHRRLHQHARRPPGSSKTREPRHPHARRTMPRSRNGSGGRHLGAVAVHTPA